MLRWCGADETSSLMHTRALPLTILTLGAALIMLAAACGSAATHPHAHAQRHTQSPPQLTAAQTAQNHANEMVLNAGSLPGYTLRSHTSEKLQDQLPPKRQHGNTVVRRLVRATWLASEHSFIASPDGKLLVFSNANLFTSSAAAARIFGLEVTPARDPRFKFFRRPAGAPAGSRLVFARGAKLSVFQLGWSQGPVMAFIRIYGHPKERFTPVEEHRIGAFLATAGNAMAHRIARIETRGDMSA